MIGTALAAASARIRGAGGAAPTVNPRLAPPERYPENRILQMSSKVVIDLLQALVDPSGPRDFQAELEALDHHRKSLIDEDTLRGLKRLSVVTNNHRGATRSDLLRALHAWWDKHKAGLKMPLKKCNAIDALLTRPEGPEGQYPRTEYPRKWNLGKLGFSPCMMLALIATS